MSNPITPAGLSLETLYNDLQIELRAYGEPRFTLRKTQVTDRQNGMAILMHSPCEGPVEVSDYPTSRGHQDFIPERSSDLDLERILYSGSALLSIACGGELARMAAQQATGNWYVLGRPQHIRPRSAVSNLYKAALRRTPEVPKPAETDVVAFSMHGIVHQPDENLCLNGLRVGLDKLTAAR